MKLMIKVIVFDMNGVVVTNFSQEVWEKHAKKLKLSVDELKKIFKEYVAWDNVTKKATAERFWLHRKNDWKNIELKDLKSLLKDLHASEKVNPEMIELIKNLRGKYKIGVLSNVSGVLPDLLKNKYQIPELVDYSLSSADFGIAKPDSKVFSKMLTKLKLKPEELIFIDDKLHNVEAAKQIGIKAMHFVEMKQLKKGLRDQKVLG